MSYTISIGENVMEVEYDERDHTIDDLTFDQVDPYALYVLVDGKFVQLAKIAADLASDEYLQDDEVPLKERNEVHERLG